MNPVDNFQTRKTARRKITVERITKLLHDLTPLHQQSYDYTIKGACIWVFNLNNAGRYVSVTGLLESTDPVAYALACFDKQHLILEEAS